MLKNDEMEELVTLLLNKSPMERLKHSEAVATIRILEANGYMVAKKVKKVYVPPAKVEPQTFQAGKGYQPPNDPMDYKTPEPVKPAPIFDADLKWPTN